MARSRPAPAPSTAPPPATRPPLRRPPLVMSARRSTWSAEETLSRADLDAVTRDVMARDEHTCLFCGFQAESDQELHHLNDDHGDFDRANLAVICMFCHMVFHIGRVGLMGEAELVWLPEMRQQELNHLARAIFVALQSDHPQRMGADALYAALRSRADDARRRLGTSDPADLGEAMLALTPSDYEARGEKLQGLRLLPLGRRIVNDRDTFPDILGRWTGAGGPFAQVPPPAWDRLLSRIQAGGAG